MSILMNVQLDSTRVTNLPIVLILKVVIDAVAIMGIKVMVIFVNL